VELAVKVCSKRGWPLVVVGKGKEEEAEEEGSGEKEEEGERPEGEQS